MSGEARRIPTYSERPLFLDDDPSNDVDSGRDESSRIRPNNPANQRRSFRCPIQEHYDSALLLDGWKKHSVCLVDQSSGGFCLSYAGNAKFKQGQVLRLRTVDGEHTVHVVYVERQEELWRIGVQRGGHAAPRSGILSTVVLFLFIAIACAAVWYYTT